MIPIKQIVCPTDFSEPSQKGVEAANTLAVAFKAGLTLVNVVTPVYPVGAPRGSGKLTRSRTIMMR